MVMYRYVELLNGKRGNFWEKWGGAMEDCGTVYAAAE